MTVHGSFFGRALCGLLIAVVLLVVVSLAGCNTASGFGRDLEALGGVISNAAD